MEATTISFDLRGLGTELKERLIAVPIYQRSYAWTREETSEFWDDLRNAFSDNAAEYSISSPLLEFRAWRRPRT